MKTLNQQAANTFRKLIQGFNDVGDNRKIDNAAGAFMAVNVEVIDHRPQHGYLIAVSHYYEQNGDLIADPDCVFWLKAFDAEQIVPISFEQGGVTYQRAVTFDGEAIHLNEKLQKDITSFCNDWMKNIQDQQNL